MDARQQYAYQVNEFKHNAGKTITELFNGEVVDQSIFDEILYDGFGQIEIFFNSIWPQIQDLEYLKHETFDNFNLGDVGVNVKLDLLCRTKDGKLCLFDWKTGSDDPRFENDLQIASYILWAIQTYGVELNQISCQLVYLKTAKIQKYNFSSERLKEIEKQILKDFEEINKTFDINYFLPSQSPHMCIKCRFSRICSYSKAGEYLNRINKNNKI